MHKTVVKQGLFKIIFIILLLEFTFTQIKVVSSAPSQSLQSNGIDDNCVHTLPLVKPSYFKRHFDPTFWKRFFKHLIPFKSADRVKMQFFLYKRDFPECGREIRIDDPESVTLSGFNPNHPTRIIIHGWMSQSKGTFNRAVKNAYINLAETNLNKKNNAIASNDTISSPKASTPGELLHQQQQHHKENITFVGNNNSVVGNLTVDFNVVVVDWSVVSSNVNYFGVVELIDDLGFLLAEFVRFLHMEANLFVGDVYIIGHSLGAQIAGSAGKQILPFRFNTIFALDPAGPKFRNRSREFRLDTTDADYVESIHTSSTFGFQEPVGHATFYPNFGKDQKKCYIYGCSHSRAHHFFAESITSKEGFWGIRCEHPSENIWVLSDTGEEYKMGGEPSTPKTGTFYVKTNDKPPFAMGRAKLLNQSNEASVDNNI